MYKNLPKILFKNDFIKFSAPSGYSCDGLLIFTSEKKAEYFSKSKSYTKISREGLLEILREQKDVLNTSGKPLTIVFNLDSENVNSKFEALYTIPELLMLIDNESSYCHLTGDDYEEIDFQNLMEQYNYQGELTGMLDERTAVEFDQAIINEIVLWKVNRYVSTKTTPDWLSLLNAFKDDKELDEPKLRSFLEEVLSGDVKGIRLAMASTFLRFRNPEVYQIIDERMYRVIMRPNARHSKLGSFTKKEEQIDLYIDYLGELKKVCDKYNIPFKNSDRILYQFDIIKNGNFN